MESSEEFLKLQSFMADFSNKKILVVGDIILDQYVYGRTERLSREGPIPVFLHERDRFCLGGAGNTLANLAGLGVKPYFAGLCGDDLHGRTIQSLMDDLSINTEGLFLQAGRQSVLKTRFLVGHQQVFRSDFEHAAVLTKAEEGQVLSYADNLMGQINAVILSDYGQKTLTPHLIQSLIAMAKDRAIPVIVDPRGHDHSLYRGASAVTPNLGELSLASGVSDLRDDAAVERAALDLAKSSDIAAVIATRSSKGMSVIENGKAAVHIRPHKKVEVFDVSGAGDTVIATVASMLACGASYKEAAELANIAGSIVVTKVGTTPIAYEELMLALQEDPATDNPYREEDKIKGQDNWLAAEQVVESWKSKGLKVGLTNGCFDILHSGHVSYLEEARHRCHKLVLGLNNDASVTMLKGPQRPINPQDIRARVMAALRSVDMVVLFGAEKEGEDNTASALLKMLKPDVYFKGGDYTPETLPETPAVEAYGGSVEILSLKEGQSTTSSIEQIQKLAS